MNFKHHIPISFAFIGTNWSYRTFWVKMHHWVDYFSPQKNSLWWSRSRSAERQKWKLKPRSSPGMRAEWRIGWVEGWVQSIGGLAHVTLPEERKKRGMVICDSSTETKTLEQGQCMPKVHDTTLHVSILFFYLFVY